MNKPYKDLIDSPVYVTHEEELYTFICTSVRRGSGRHQYMLNIVGIGEKTELKGKQLQFEFNGQKFGAVIEEAWVHGDKMKVDLGTIVNDPEFWR